MEKSVQIHLSWKKHLEDEFKKAYWQELTNFVRQQYSISICFPEWKNIFRAFDITPFDQVKVIMLWQDPYHTPGAAMGLSFSITPGSKIQPSLQNIFKELASDLGIFRSNTDLTDWAEQGVFLLNSVLTVESGIPASHARKGWETFTDAIISELSTKREWLIFVLWGNYAWKKISLIDETRHSIIVSPHPSPFSAHKGFFGSKPFSRVNEILEKSGREEIRW